MTRTRYYAALNAVRARRPEYRREDSSESISSAIAAELETLMVLPARSTTNAPTLPSQQAMYPSYNTIITTEMELTLRPAQSFLVPALCQVPNLSSILYYAPLDADGAPIYPLIPLSTQLKLEAEAGAMALEANDAEGAADKNETQAEDSSDNIRASVISDASSVQYESHQPFSPVPRPSGPRGHSRRASKTFEGMILEQDVTKGFLHNYSSTSSEMSLEEKPTSAPAKNSKRFSFRAGLAKCGKFLCGKDDAAS